MGETAGQIDKKSKLGTNPLKFSPALSIGNVTNTDNWSIRQGYATDFSAPLATAGTIANISSAKVAHMLDIDSNLLLSYQNPSVTVGGTKNCEGYVKTITTFNGVYMTGGSLDVCNRPNSSNILITPDSLTSTLGFSWTPKIIYAAPQNSTVKYTSQISYKNGTVDVKYPSFARSTASNTLANGTVVGTSNGVVNQSVKILGVSNSNNLFDVLQGNTSNKISSMTRVDLKNTIHKNVTIMTR